MNVQKAQKKLEAISAQTKRMTSKRAELENIRSHIMASLPKSSLRQIHAVLQESGWTGSLALLHAVVKKWKHTCPACSKALVKRLESTKQPGNFYWLCPACRQPFHDKRGTFTGTVFEQKPKQPVNNTAQQGEQKPEQPVNGTVNSNVNSSANS